jgi:hypothetical protein
MKKMPPTADPDRELLGAAMAGDLKQLRSLLAKGADVNTPNAAGQTPLVLATAMGHSAAVELLMQSGSNVNAADHTGTTGLMLASMQGNSSLRCLATFRFASAAIDRSGNIKTCQAATCRPPRCAARFAVLKEEIFAPILHQRADCGWRRPSICMGVLVCRNSFLVQSQERPRWRSGR